VPTGDDEDVEDDEEDGETLTVQNPPSGARQMLGQPAVDAAL
jgi:hypothetical protein